MTTLRQIQTSSALAACTLVLSACGMSTPQGNAATAQPNNTSPIKMANHNNGWVTASQKHNNSGISLRYRIDGQPVTGQAFAVQLEFSGVSAENAQIQFSFDKALAASVPIAMQKISTGYRLPLTKGQVNAQTLMITPSADGMHYIRLEMAQAGRGSASSIAIPVGNGPFATPTLGEVQTTSSGEKIIVMPAGK